MATTKKTHDTPKCKKCKGRTALVYGYFDYEPDPEPFKNGVEEDCNVKGNVYIHGHICEKCGNIHNMWQD